MEKLMVYNGTNVETFCIGTTVYLNPYHVGKCLGLTDSAVRKAVMGMTDRQAVKLKNSDVKDSNIRKLNNAGELFLTESGVYKLAFRSNKPGAEKFTNWVADEVLPAIHRTGEYRMKPKASAKPALPAEYEYFPKTFRGEPVMTTQDIAHAIDRDVRSVASFVKRSANLFPGADFKLLTGTLLREFERENPKLSSGHNKLYVIYRSGVEKLFGIWKPKEGAPMLPPPEPEFVDPVNDKAYMKLVDDIEYTMHFMSMLLRRSLKKGSYEDFKKMAVNIQNVGFEVADQAYHFTLWKPERESNPVGAENALR